MAGVKLTNAIFINAIVNPDFQEEIFKILCSPYAFAWETVGVPPDRLCPWVFDLLLILSKMVNIRTMFVYPPFVFCVLQVFVNV